MKANFECKFAPVLTFIFVCRCLCLLLPVLVAATYTPLDIDDTDAWGHEGVARRGCGVGQGGGL